MIIGIVRAEFYFPQSGSLKEKRMVVQSLKQKLRADFNVAVAEVGGHDKWQRATLAFVTVGTDKASVNSQLSRLVNRFEFSGDAQLLDYELELM